MSQYTFLARRFQREFKITSNTCALVVILGSHCTLKFDILHRHNYRFHNHHHQKNCHPSTLVADIREVREICILVRNSPHPLLPRTVFTRMFCWSTFVRENSVVLSFFNKKVLRKIY